MDSHVKDYYCHSSDGGPHGNFHSVIALNDAPDTSWKAIKSKVPQLSQGWYELARLNVQDRLDFTRDFWLSKLPYQLNLDSFLNKFFSSLDDIAVFITQRRFDDPYEVHLIYSLKNDSGFFQGSPPIDDQKLQRLKNLFPDYMLPKDYLAFLQIHNGFKKATDCTGVIASDHIGDAYDRVQQLLSREPIITSKGTTVDPKTLIPFYESFGMPYFQCFWAEWYPAEEMGNVYYSGQTNTISSIDGGLGEEIMAFPTFVDWLVFYLERVET